MSFHFKNEIETYLENEPNKNKTTLYVFDFDSTLFKSPLPSSKLWSSKLVGKLISECWWFCDPRPMNPPFIPKDPGNEWWDEKLSTLASNAMQDDANIVIMLTGRNRKLFRDRIVNLIHGKTSPSIPFPLIFCKETKSIDSLPPIIPKTYNSTFDFKSDVLMEIFTKFPTITHVELFDDRVNHIKLFQKLFDQWKKQGVIKSYNVNLAVIEEKRLDPILETELVLDLVKTHNDRIDSNPVSTNSCPIERPIELVDEIEYAAIFLEQDSKDILTRKFPMPLGWKLKCDHMTISYSYANNEMIDLLGGLGSHHKLFATHFGNLPDACAAVKIRPSPSIASENENMHITLYVSQSGYSKQSNDIVSWELLPEPIELQGVLGVKKVTGIKPTPQMASVKKDISIGSLVMKHHPGLAGKDIGKIVSHIETWMSKQFVCNLEENRVNIEFFIKNLDILSLIS